MAAHSIVAVGLSLFLAGRFCFKIIVHAIQATTTIMDVSVSLKCKHACKPTPGVAQACVQRGGWTSKLIIVS